MIDLTPLYMNVIWMIYECYVHVYPRMLYLNVIFMVVISNPMRLSVV